MEYRQLGSSDLNISAVAFGAWAIGGFMWGGTDDDAAISAMNTAFDLGVTAIDTAPVYGFGHSEDLVAKVIKGRRDKFQIFTKYCLRWEEDSGALHFERTGVDGNPIKIYRNARKESIVKECEDSLRRLGTDYIDLYQQHWPVPENNLHEAMGALDQLLADGKIRAAGVCNFNVEQVEEAMDYVDLVSVQPPYSMINRNIEEDLLPFCHVGGIGVIPYSPLQRGILTGKISVDHQFPDNDHRSTDKFFERENREKTHQLLDNLRPIAQAHNATLAQLVIRWTITRPGVTAALVGARNPSQAKENAASADLDLSAEELNRITAFVDQVELDI